MNLKPLIQEKLWLSLSSTYDTGNYSHAVVDAIHYLSDRLREKSGVDGDGASLVGQALGGQSPKLKINKLQTETEQNVQKGLEHLLRGIYLGIRNPRSHEQIDDKKEDADAIILFINYLLSILEKSEEPFTISKFKSRVFDPAFVESEKYAQLLVNEIPEKKRLDTLIEIYREKYRGSGTKLKYIFDELYKRITNDQMDDFFAIVSEDLKSEQSTNAIIIFLQFVEPTLWTRIEESARIRIENMLIESIKSGEMEHDSETNSIEGALGTWITQLDLSYSFTLRNELMDALIKKLQSTNYHERRYISTFFLSALPKIFLSETERKKCISVISKAVKKGGRHFINSVIAQLGVFGVFPANWQNDILTSLKVPTEDGEPLIYSPDGTHFLETFISFSDVDEPLLSSMDDIPF